ncbi:hypothetical protein [Lentibacillus sp. CBA3610]|uniref:hypothetical protein n=1 Tax=Lentibacillus sp. CBA3610 TaxID=2518176 RepID=UPI0020D229EF|nr:hypothetical protein [Lentibacillus sp. CBA3610]
MNLNAIGAIIKTKGVIDYMGMEFLYFPEDKTEYIPSIIILTIFIIGAAIALKYFIKKSKKEAEKVDEEYQQTSNEDYD